ncbi:MAG: glycosyltransferase family 2 protein [Acidobacteria bacterium]|nr:MAG: glycosyltransferase family 2 protein [Acidobacteriota bacterium]
MSCRLAISLLSTQGGVTLSVHLPARYMLPESSAAIPSTTSHISVCICTYKRPEFLRRLLNDLFRQDTGVAFTYSIVVVDNDKLCSAQTVVSELAADSTISVSYCVEPRQNIALARNMAVENAQGDFIAFIDDDEFPTKGWLATLFRACHEYNVDGVLGPVKPQYDTEVPKWVIRGRFYDRPTYPTGLVIDGRKGRTGNLLLKKRIFPVGEPAFRPEFLTGEDQDFFRRMIARGHVFIWCNEAVAYEVVSPVRWQRNFMLRRALLCGRAAVIHPAFGMFDIAKSVVAVPAYILALPFVLVLGHHRFMSLLVKLFDHLGKLLAFLGISPVKQQYVTD